MLRSLTFCVLCSFLLAHSGLAGELSTAWTSSGPSNSRIILEKDQLASKGVSRAGVQIRLSEGWWTYWRAPGSSGIPPQFDWSGSENIASEPEMTWPIPIRAVAYGEQLNLYRNQIVFPVTFRAANPKRPVTLRLRLTYGVCKNMCVPATVEHRIMIAPANMPKPDVSETNVRLIAAYSSQRPTSDPLSTGFEIREVWERRSQEQVQLGVRIQGLHKKLRPLVLVEGPSFFRASEIIPRPLEDQDQAAFVIKVGSPKRLQKLTGKRIRITIIDGPRALEQIWVVGASGSSAAGTGLTPVSVSSPADRPQP